MGFLDKLWDETLAGPLPESGLGKLRKYNSFSASSGFRSPPVKEDVPISRSIMIIRTHSNFGRGTVSEPVSPCSSAPTSPRTPLSPLETPRGNFKKFTRRKLQIDPTESSDNRR